MSIEDRQTDSRREGSGRRSVHPFTRRTVLQAGAATGAASALSWAGTAGTAAAQDRTGEAKSDGRPGKGAGWFTDPARDVRPKFRWWWPDGLVTPTELRKEINQIADAGFGGVEIAAVHHSVDDPSVLDTAHHGWGSPSWLAGVEAALDQADLRGLTVDITIGPAWPAAVPTVTPDSAGALHELAHGFTAVAAGATYAGPVPAAAAPSDGVTVQKLIAVQALRLDPANGSTKVTGLAGDSLVDLTDTVEDGQLTWTAPDDTAPDAAGDWHLIAYWQRGVGQTPERGPHSVPTAYVVDHFSPAGTGAVTDFWESHLLTRPVRKLIERAGGSLFEDSIELESDAVLWTPALLDEFRKRRGYSLLPYLPVVLQNKGNGIYAYDKTLTLRAQHDYWQTLSDLYNEHHATAVKKWAHSIGLKLRAQPYGLQTDATYTSAILDIPEGESLGFHNLDDYRSLTGGRNMAGNTILSCEAGAYAGGAYSTTWKKFLLTMGGAYAAGVNQTVIHGFSYADLPGVKWPGYAAFTPYDGAVGYGESWGPRHPTWQHIKEMADYLGRTGGMLQTGRPRIDVALFRQSGFAKTGLGASWFTATGVPLGWTQDFISEPLLDLKSAKVTHGRLAEEGPAYQVVFVEGDRFYGTLPTLSVATAEKFLRYTKAGLPFIFLGDWSAPTIPGVDPGGQDAKLADLMAELLAQPRVRLVSALTEVGAALDDLGLAPYVSYGTSSTLLHADRVTGDATYYYFCNGKHQETPKQPVAPIDHEVTLPRANARDVPYVLDLWTGRIDRLAAYTEDSAGKITFRVALQPGETLAIAVGAPDLLGDRSGSSPHIVSTDASESLFDGGHLAVRATADGTYTTSLSHGRPARTRVSGVPQPLTLDSWTLDVEDWQPGANATTTTVVRHHLALDALAAWPGIPELADVSGIGTYRTTFSLGDAWTGGRGAYLRLGTVYDTCRVTVNGTLLPPVDRINPVADLGGHLRRGVNTLEVEVATTLGNRLRVSDPEVYGGSSRQPYGLVGPVQLVPYGQVTVG